MSTTKTASKPTASRKEMLVNEPYHVMECILFGSIANESVTDLENRLAGLCDPGCIEFHEHEMVFSLRTQSDADVTTLRLRRKFNVDPYSSAQWRVRYMGRPEPDANCPVLVRKVIDSVCYSPNIMEFVKTLGIAPGICIQGLRLDYEYIGKGKAYTAGLVKILVYNIQKTDKPGTYEPTYLKKLNENSTAVEISMTIPDGAEYNSAARQLRSFSDQFFPLIEMQKVEYTNK